MDLSLSNVINISVSAAQAGIGAYNTSNLAIFTREEAGDDFGTDGYKIYLDPSEVITDFGTDSVTAKMANSVFSQKPNILAGNGYLVVIPLLENAPAVTEVQHAAFSSVPAVGNFQFRYSGNNTANIAYNANAAAVQTALRAVSGLSSVTVAGNTTSGFDITLAGVTGDPAMLTVVNNSLQDSGPYDVTVTVTETTKGVAANSAESVNSAISRTKDLVQYFGVIAAEIMTSTPVLATAAAVQALNKIAFVVQRDSATVDSGGLLDQLATGSYSQTRGLYYGSDNDTDALVMAAAYAGRALSTDFSGSNTTQTMHLKDLIGVQPDPSMTQNILTKCIDAGVDVYASLQGVPKIFTSGANGYFDDVYNEQWFVGALQVATFNALAQSSTKLPQTEDGVSILKGAHRQVCEQAVTNKYAAPGEWSSSTTFGNQGDFLRNISERGYYIYSGPVATQLASDRAARKAPLIQIALKQAGAIHQSSVIIYVNA